VVSAGTEFSVTMDSYLDYALGLPSTRAIGLFMESSRDPAGLRSALHRAAEQEVPVVCLRSAVARGRVGSLSLTPARWPARTPPTTGIRRLRGAARRRPGRDVGHPGAADRGPAPRKGGLAAVTDSGGEPALLADLAADLGVPFAEIGENTLGRLRRPCPARWCPTTRPTPGTCWS
jgi:acyl-CoA synthetase (NDP forming)